MHWVLVVCFFLLQHITESHTVPVVAKFQFGTRYMHVNREYSLDISFFLCGVPSIHQSEFSLSFQVCKDDITCVNLICQCCGSPGFTPNMNMTTQNCVFDLCTNIQV